MKQAIALITGLLFTCPVLAVITVEMQSTETNELLGIVEFQDSEYGLLISPQLNKLPAGVHGFHMHSVASCENKGMAANGHYDPEETGTHAGPYGNGHLGDLPVMIVDRDGSASLPLLAPRLEEADLLGHSLIIHEGGDNYSDEPTLGGGGSRIACGIIPVP